MGKKHGQSNTADGLAKGVQNTQENQNQPLRMKQSIVLFKNSGFARQLKEVSDASKRPFDISRKIQISLDSTEPEINEQTRGNTKDVLLGIENFLSLEIEVTC
jgi:hypothetical protein